MPGPVSACALALCVLSSLPAQQKPPTATELDAMVAKFFAADDKTREGHAERINILARLASLPPLTANDLAAWRGKIQKARSHRAPVRRRRSSRARAARSSTCRKA